MIKRNYLICCAVVKRSGVSRRTVWASVTQTSWRPRVFEIIDDYKDHLEIKDDEALEIYSITRIPRFF